MDFTDFLFTGSKTTKTLIKTTNITSKNQQENTHLMKEEHKLISVTQTVKSIYCATDWTDAGKRSSFIHQYSFVRTSNYS